MARNFCNDHFRFSSVAIIAVIIAATITQQLVYPADAAAGSKKTCGRLKCAGSGAYSYKHSKSRIKYPPPGGLSIVQPKAWEESLYRGSGEANPIKSKDRAYYLEKMEEWRTRRRLRQEALTKEADVNDERDDYDSSSAEALDGHEKNNEKATATTTTTLSPTTVKYSFPNIPTPQRPKLRRYGIRYGKVRAKQL